jgi:hypothetical protein
VITRVRRWLLTLLNGHDAGRKREGGQPGLPTESGSNFFDLAELELDRRGRPKIVTDTRTRDFS